MYLCIFIHREHCVRGVEIFANIKFLWHCLLALHVTCDMWHGWYATMGPSGNFFRVPFSTMAASLQITTSWSPSPSQSREHLRSIPTSAGIFSLFSNFRFCNSAAVKRNKHLVNAPVWELPYIGLQAGGIAAEFLNRARIQLFKQQLLLLPMLLLLYNFNFSNCNYVAVVTVSLCPKEKPRTSSAEIVCFVI